MKHSILTILFALSALITSAQQTSFELTANITNNDVAADIVENADGDFVAVTTTVVSNNFDVTLIKFSAAGVVLATATIGTSQNEIAKSICTTADGGYFITGYANTTFSDNDALVIKVDSSFQIQFMKRFGTTPGNDYANEGFEASPGQFTFTGTIAIGGSAKPSRVTLDENGIVISQSYLNTNQFASPNYRGNYLGNGLIGFAHLSNAISIVDTSGNVVRDFPFTAGTFTSSVIRTNDGKFVAIGLANLGGSSTTVSFCKADTTTNLLSMTNEYGYNGFSLEPVGIVQDAQNNYFIAVNKIDNGTGFSKAMVVKTNPLGTVLWGKQYNAVSTIDGRVNSIILTSDGGIMIAGSIDLTGTNPDLFFAKIDSFGSSTCNTLTVTIASSTYSPNSATPHTMNAGTINTITLGTPYDFPVTPLPNLMCITIDINDVTAKDMSVKVYPTLFDQFVTVESDEPSQRLNVCITDLNGSEVFRKSFYGNEQLNLSNLASGSYIINIENAEKSQTIHRKLIKATFH